MDNDNPRTATRQCMIATSAGRASNALTCLHGMTICTAQGLSQRQAAKVLDVPRSTLQAWRAYHEQLG